jgi:hypothetical protein
VLLGLRRRLTPAPMSSGKSVRRLFGQADWDRRSIDARNPRGEDFCWRARCVEPHLRRGDLDAGVARLDRRPHRSSSAKVIHFDNDTAFREQALLRNMRHTTGFATLTPHRKKAASKTPTDTYVDGCRTTWISTGPAGHPADRPHDQLIPVNALV